MDRRNFVALATTPGLFFGADDKPATASCSVNVADYGAVGDGATDDTAAVQAALTSVPAAGALVCVPPGTYLISQPLSIRSNTYLKGSGAGTVFKRTGSSDAVFFSSSVNQVTVESIAIDLDGAQGATPDIKSFATGLGFRTQCSDIRIRDIQVFDSTGTNVCCRHGILVLESSRVWIERNRLTNGLRLKAGGVGDKLIIEGNVISDANDNAITVATDASPSVTTNYVIRNNIVEDARGVYIYVGDDGATVDGLVYENIIIDGNILVGNARAGMLLVRLASKTSRVTISNNTLVSTSTSPFQYSAGIQTTIQTATGKSGAGFLIANNTVDGCFDHAGIWVQSLEHARVVHNHVSNSTPGDGIRLESLNAAIVEGNVVTKGQRGVWWCGDCFRMSMIGNCITDCTGDGVVFAPRSGSALAISAVLLGNIVRDNAGAGIREVVAAPIGTRYLFNDLRLNAGTAIPGIGSQAALIGNEGTSDYIRHHFSSTVAWDPPAVAHGSAVAATFNIVGARLGDTVVVSHSRRLPARALLTGAVTGKDQVTVTLLNMTGLSQNLPSGDLRIDVWQH